MSPTSILAAMSRSFTDMHRATKKFDLPLTCVCSWGWTRQHFAFLFQLSNYKQISFLWSTFFTFLSFLVVTFLFKIAPNCSAVYGSQMQACASRRKCVCYVSIAQVWVLVLLATGSRLMNQQYSWSREGKRKSADLYIRLLWKVLK